MNEVFNIKQEVREALSNKKPVVALESTVIAHGLPYPQNIETAIALDDIVREYGVVPAMICIKDGKINVGLTRSEVEFLAAQKSKALKVSTRDLSFALSQRLLGATTVASTMYCAKLCGIIIFATGGLGGVHRDGHISLDMSADMTELGKTKIAVVCAGIKSILDIAKTLECLETLRVPVIGYQTDDFPAFYSQKSGHKLPFTLDTPDAINGLIKTHFCVADTGIVIANPIAKEHEIPQDVIESLIQSAMRKAYEQRITGPSFTPFMLKELFLASEGKTLTANIELLKSNARLAAAIASRTGSLPPKL